MGSKDIKAAVRACNRAGLRHEWHAKHPRIVDPRTGKFVVFSGSPGCPHAHKNTLRDVKKYLGVEVRL